MICVSESVGILIERNKQILECYESLCGISARCAEWQGQRDQISLGGRKSPTKLLARGHKSLAIDITLESSISISLG